MKASKHNNLFKSFALLTGTLRRDAAPTPLDNALGVMTGRSMGSESLNFSDH